MTPALALSGTVRPGLERVADAFAASFAGRPDMGAALCVYIDGEPVVDLWGGVADPRTGAPWREETLSVIFSCTKGLLALICARLVEEGRLDYDDRVARWWPAFAEAGKADVRVRHLLSHQAGLSAPREQLSTADILDWDRVAAILAAQAPLWPPGSGHAYHALTYGWLVGEVIRRVTGKSVGAVLAETIAAPLGAAAHIGLPQDLHSRMARMQVNETSAAGVDILAAGEAWLLRAMTLGGALPAALVEPDGGFNDPRLWSAEIPGAGGIADARSLARIWSAAVADTGGFRLLEPGTVTAATRPQSSGAPVFDVPPPWSAWGMGFQLDSEARRYLTPAGFGHDGAGGQVAFAEPGLRIGFAYLTNFMEGAGDRRATAVIDALRDAVAGGQ